MAHRGGTLLGALALVGGVSLILFLHGAWWWYAPLALLLVVPAHRVVLGVGVWLVSRRGGGHGRGAVLHDPRGFDRMARWITLGREGELRQWTLDRAEPRPGEAVLDVGCGTGTLLAAAAERVGGAGEVRGVEPSPEMAERAREKARERGVAVEVVEGVAEDLPYPADSFDVVFCSLALHHVEPSMRGKAIREMRRVLRPGGRLVIVEWQRPRSLARALASPLFLVFLLHAGGPGRSPLDAREFESSMRECGFGEVARSSFGAGVVGAVVGRVGAGDRP